MGDTIADMHRAVVHRLRTPLLPRWVRIIKQNAQAFLNATMIIAIPISGGLGPGPFSGASRASMLALVDAYHFMSSHLLIGRLALLFFNSRASFTSHTSVPVALPLRDHRS